MQDLQEHLSLIECLTHPIESVVKGLLARRLLSIPDCIRDVLRHGSDIQAELYLTFARPLATDRLIFMIRLARFSWDVDRSRISSGGRSVDVTVVPGSNDV